MVLMIGLGIWTCVLMKEVERNKAKRYNMESQIIEEEDKYGDEDKKSSNSKSTRANDSIEMSRLSKLDSPLDTSAQGKPSSIMSRFSSFLSLNKTLPSGQQKGGSDEEEDDDENL